VRNGRPRLPKSMHVLHGNPGGRKLDDIEEPVPRGPLGDPPSWLGDDAREVWTSLQDVMPLAIVTAADLPTMSAYCSAVALHRRAVVELRATGGAVIRNHDGDLVKNPWLFVQDRQATLILRLASERALSPASRAAMASRLAIAGGSAPRRSNSLDDYLAEKPDKLAN